MAPRIVLLAALLVASPALAGCLGLGGGGDDEGVERTSKSRADVTDRTGGIEGIVADDAVAPIVGAGISLGELDLTATTADDGSFAFSRLPPATYTVSVSAEGFVASTQTVAVGADQVAVADFVLVHLLSAVPYMVPAELNGFMECGFAIGYNVTGIATPPALPPPAPSPGPSEGLISYTVCAEVNSRFEHTTNDRFAHVLDLDPPMHTFVIETTWQPATAALSDILWVAVDPAPELACGSIEPCAWTMLDHWGPSPLRGEVDRAKLEAVQANVTRLCEEGSEAFCGFSFFDEGWPVLLRTFARWECQPSGPQACVILQQAFTHYVSAFFNAPAPDGYSALS